MKSNIKHRVTRSILAVAALALALCLLPVTARADDNISLPKLEDVTDETEKTYYTTPAAHAGESLTIYIPVKNTSTPTKEFSNVSCKLYVVGNPDSFPFIDIGTSTYFEADPYQKWMAGGLVSWDGSELSPGERAYFRLTATLQTTVAPGSKDLSFVIDYDEAINGGTAIPHTDTFRRTITVKTPVAEPTPVVSSGGSGFRSKPKVIVESYQFSQEQMFAGDQFSLTLVIRNTSEKEAIRNLQLNYANESGAIMPAAGSSNSIYIGEILKNESTTLTIPLTLAPDAEARAHPLAVTLAYEGTRNRAEFTETTSVSVPIMQKTRVRINSPVVYDGPWIGSPATVGVTLFNLGKSPLYNATLELAPNDMLTQEESYFGGNIASGGTMRAELSVTPQVGGQIEGVLLLTYEDVYGNQTKEELPLTMQVNEQLPFEVISTFGNAMPAEEVMSPEQGGSPVEWYWWAGGGAALLAAVVAVGVKMRKNRARALEEL